jgi:dTDP-4-amino-4,6-dideoxygalactose transaminase
VVTPPPGALADFNCIAVDGDLGFDCRLNRLRRAPSVAQVGETTSDETDRGLGRAEPPWDGTAHSTRCSEVTGIGTDPGFVRSRHVDQRPGAAGGSARDPGENPALTERKILLSPPSVGPLEREMLLDAFDSGWIAPAGPDLSAFEREVAAAADVSHGVALSSGTAALHLCLQLAGVGEADPVLVPSFTFAASANPVIYRSAEPIFVDVSAETWTIDPALVADELARAQRCGRPVKALIAVDIYGQCADYDDLSVLCAEHGVTLIEDAAEALGATYRGRKAGSLAGLAAVSFNGNKIITCGGGGMLLTDDAESAERARHLATQARDPAAHYEHSVVGYNYRLSNLLAAVGRAQLRTLDARVAARRRTNALYREAFSQVAGLTVMPEAPYGVSSHWLTCVLIDEKEFGASPEQVRLALAMAGIEARPTWKPLHLQGAYRGRRMVGGDVCESLFARGLCLPSGHDLTEDDIARVTAAVTAVGTGRAVGGS